MADEVTRVWVGACGKHPGWDDHIADQGLETEFMVRVRRLLYVEGIGGNIDAGSWEELSSEDRAAGFDHVFLWRAPDGLMVGRMWSSSDGKGRTRYPMIVCAQSRGLSCDWVVGPCLARLEQLAEECRQTSSAGAVITAVDGARADLRRMSASAPEASRQPLPPPAALATISDGCAAGQDPDGLVRVLYQLEREFGSFLMLEDASDTRSRTIDVRPRHMRVPSCQSDIAHSCVLWMRFLLERVDPAASLLLFGRVGGSHLDLIVGEPARAQIFHLQASGKRTPLTTAIPYTIDADFRARVEARVAGARSGAVRDIDPGRVTEEAPRRRAPAKKSQAKLPTWAIAVGAVVVLAVLVWLVMAAIGSGGESKPVTPTPELTLEEPKPTGEQTPIATVDDADVETFQRWCLAYDGWLAKLVTDARRSQLFAADPYLSGNVLEPIRAAVSGGFPLDPNVVVASPATSVRALAMNPPADAQSAEVAAAARSAVKLVDGLEAGLRAWPAREELARAAEQLAAWKLSRSAEELASAARGAVPSDGGDVAGSCERVAALSQIGLPTTLAQLREMFSTLDQLAGVGDQKLTEAAGQVREQVIASLSALSAKELAARPDELSRIADLRRTLEAARTHWNAVDAELFRARASVYVGDAAGRKSWDLLQSWREEVGQPGYAKLDPAMDPRVGASLESAAAELRAKARELGSKAQADAEERARAVEEAVSEWSESVRALYAMPWNGFTERQVFRETEQLRAQAGQLQSSLDALAMEVEADIGERVADLRARSARFDSDALNQAWVSGRDALGARLDSNGDAIAFLRSALELERQLRQLAEASSMADVIEQLPDACDDRAVRDLVREHRSTAVADHLPQSAPGSWTEAEVTGSASAVSAELSGFTESLKSAVSDLDAIASAVGARYGLGESLGSGETIRSIWQRAQGRIGSQAVSRIAPGLARTIGALVEIEEAPLNATALREMAEASTEPAVAWQAWLKLGTVDGWPGGPEELRVDLDLLKDLQPAFTDVADGSRRQALVKRSSAESARRWAMASERVSSWTDLAACGQLQGEAGGDVSALSPTRQFAMAVSSARPMIAPVKEDGRNQELAAGLIRRADELGMAAAPAWASLLMGLRELAEEDPSAVPPLDPAAVGPARAGWEAQASDDGEELVYRLPGHPEVTLTFGLVTMDDGRSSFVCKDELSVGVLIAMVRVDDSVARDLVSILGWPGERLLQAPPPGMHVWKWSGSEQSPQIGLADAWVPQWCTPTGAINAPDAGSSPSLEHPLQRISLEAAIYIAGRLGCRPTTVDEWRAAYKTSHLPPNSGWNLRDSVVSRQIEHMKSDRFTGSPMRLPDAASFSGADKQIDCYTFDDGRLWLSKAQEGPTTAFRHIVGNVLEFALLDFPEESRSELSEAIHSGAWSATRARDLAKSLSAGVIGGSVFSSAGAELDGASNTVNRRTSWTDVGLRLAFSSDEGRVRRSVGSRLSNLLDATELPDGEGTR